MRIRHLIFYSAKCRIALSGVDLPKTSTFWVFQSSPKKTATLPANSTFSRMSVAYTRHGRNRRGVEDPVPTRKPPEDEKPAFKPWQTLKQSQKKPPLMSTFFGRTMKISHKRIFASLQYGLARTSRS